MGVEENLRLIDEVTKAMNKHNLDEFESYHLPSATQYDPVNVGGLHGAKAIRASAEPMARAFPDLRVELNRKFGQGEWVSVQGLASGTHTGPFEVPGGETIPATNRQVKFPFALIARVEGGKFAEVNLYYDQMGFMAQLGLVPPPSPPTKT